MKSIRSADLRAAKLLKVAAKILSTKGYDKTSLEDIANAMGITKAGLYYYIKSKEDLLYKILSNYMDRLINGIKAIDNSNTDSLNFFKEAIRFQVNIYKADPYCSKIIIHDENCLSGSYFKSIKAKQIEYLTYWKNRLIQFAEQYSIELDYPSVYVHLLIGICNWIYQWYNARGSVKPEDLAERIFKIFFHGFLSLRNTKRDEM